MRFTKMTVSVLAFVWCVFVATEAAHAQPGTVLSHAKISDTVGSMIDDSEWFGRSVASLGDLDGDGPSVLAAAVAAPRDDDGGIDRGAVWILFLDDVGTVLSEQKISDTAGGFTGILDDFDHFGSSVTSLGDLDCGGVEDLPVGARRDDGILNYSFAEVVYHILTT